MARTLRAFIAAGVTTLLAVGMMGQAPAQAAKIERLKPQVDESVAGSDMGGTGGKTGRTGKPYAPKPAVFPSGSALVDVASLGMRDAAGSVKAGHLPVRVDRLGSTAKRLKVEVLDRKQTEQAKIPGVVMRVQSTDGKGGMAKVALDYSAFASAYGADWGSRLRLVQLPECALTTPDAAECVGTPLNSANDVESKTLSSDLELAPTTMVAATAAPSGSAGDYAATSLQPSSTWSAGGNFSWSYPMRVPPAPGGLAPKVELAYSSQSVDGRMAASNNQPSWIGEGFDYQPGFIERRYKACDKKTSGDLCQVTDNATLSLNGSSTELIYEEGKGWHGRSDDGSRIERRTGVGNGDDNGEHWVVTAPNGTQYWFGFTPAANSTWTVPVKVSGAWTTQAWRWNLDHVVDVLGNTMSLNYQKETNKYARNGVASDLAAYDRGGYLTHINYGTRNDAGGQAPVQVAFDVADRCVTSNCGTHDAVNWPDVPWDQECTGGTCYVGSPTFWTTKRLSTVTTRLWNGSAYTDVERWTFHHTFPDPGDGTRAGLWLDKISHVGLVGGTASLPDITFSGVQLQNRVDTIDHSPSMNWWRISQIHTETGGSINVSYSSPECVAGSNIPGAPETNNKRCYPVRWTPPGYADPITDYFHKYVVTAVTESDDATGSVRVLHKYDYIGDPAWHFADDDGLIEAQDKTWSQWRGYGTVRTTTGDPHEQTVTEARFFRGMHGDYLPWGTRWAQLPAAGTAPAVDDEDAFAGMVRETLTYNGAEVIGSQVNEPWQSAATASRTINGSTVHARFTGTGASHSGTTLDGGRAPRTSTTRNTHDGYGMVVKSENSGDNAIAGDEQCTLTTYEPRNTTAWITNLPHRVQGLARDCASEAPLTEADIVNDIRTSYDQADFGNAPSQGLVSTVETLKSLGGYLTTGTSVYDKWGRVIEATDIKGNKSTTTYTHNAGGQLSSTKMANHLGWETTTTLEPAWGTTLSTVDPNGRLTEVTYDGLGRTTAVWLPGRSKASATASVTYAYLVRNNAPTVVTTSKLNSANSYITSHVLYDGLLRTRQTQSPEAGTAGGRIVTDTKYDSAGRAFMALGPYVADGTPASDLFTATYESAIRQQTLSKFDGAGRLVEAVFQPQGIKKFSTITSYGGDRVDVTPPAGGTPTSTVTDIRGKTIELRQYKGATPLGDYDATRYAYNNKGQQTSVVDTAGNTWSYTYDLMGRQISASDPDKGTTTSAYNDYNELVATTDARSETLAYVYDSFGRKVSMHDDTAGGAKRAEWVYDTLVKGKPTKSIRYDGTNAYINEVSGYNTAYQPTGTRVTIPASDTGLAGTYSYTNAYYADGSPKTTRLPALGGLAQESLTYNYNGLGLPTHLDTSIGAVNGVPASLAYLSYTRYGELGVIGRWYEGGAKKWIDTGYSYDDDTRRLTEILTGRETNPSLVSRLYYTYDQAGNILSQQDVTPGAEERQCYQYDYLRRLTEAWTPSSPDCAANPSASLGGPAPYWTSWEFDAVGNRTKQVEHATADGDRTTTYSYPAAHQLSERSTTDNTGTITSGYTYDSAGNTATRGGSQLTWDAEGHLAADSDGSSYLYDADGNRLVSRDGAGKTLHLPGQELRYTSSGGAKVGTRYYSFGGQTIGQRVGSTVTWLINDHQGTSSASVAESNQAVTRRYQTPYGTSRGSQPSSWANNKGFVGGTKDPNGLTHLGAREYDPVIGRFLSVDPIMDLADPQQWNAYGYANGSPITKSDPSGLSPECGAGGGSQSYSCSNNVKKANGGGSWSGLSDSTHYVMDGAELDDYNSRLDDIRENKESRVTWLFNQWMSASWASTDTVWQSVKGLGQMAWECNTISVAINGGGCGVYDLAATAITDPAKAGSQVWRGITDPMVTDWKNGDYLAAISRGVTEAALFVVGPKGAGALSKAGRASSAVTQASKVAVAAPTRPAFVADAAGTVIPTSASRLEAGLQAAVDAGAPGFGRFATTSPGIGYNLPSGLVIRIMQPTPYAGLRASFTKGMNSPVSPFTGKPVQPPPGTTNTKQWVRDRTHIVLEP